MGCLLRRVACVACVGLAAALAGSTAANADPDRSPPLAEFGIQAHQQRAMMAGAIVSADGGSAMFKELMGSVAMRLPIPPAELARQIRDGLNVIADPRMEAFVAIDGRDDDAVWRSLGYAPSQLSEARKFAAAEPGTAFNLSAAERAAVHRRFAELGDASAEETVALASAAWREVLAGRLRAYREKGIGGLAEYDRGDSASSPADELRHGNSAPYVPPSLAAFVRAIGRYPALPPGIDSRFFWKKTEIDDRPAFVLAHVLVEERHDGVRFALREYYVSHAYNVLQQFGLAMPAADGGSTVMAINSTITDRLPGVFTSLARSIGERRARDALEDYFVNIRRAASAGARVSGG